MNSHILMDTARALVAGDKGLLAMDESTPTCDKRFAATGIPQTEEARRAYRELIVTTPGLAECISGVILYDETIRQQTKDGTPFLKVLTDAGIIPGIKVDAGAKDMAGHPGEKITEGLDGLRDRLQEYSRTGARFAKWRTVIAVGGGLPSRGCVEANAHALARYAALCQEAGLVPIVEPEVLTDGDHTLERCAEVTSEVLRAVFRQLNAQRVMLEGMLLKPNMVTPGSECPRHEAMETVADATVTCLLRTVPAAVPGIAFLSGGQPGGLASARLNAMNRRPTGAWPWGLAFSFARAIQQPALEIWRGQEANVRAAHQALLHRAECNRAARRIQGCDGGCVKSLIVFDLDGTLAESKSSLDDEMAALLHGLLGVVRVAVISGGDWPQFEKQLLSHLVQDDRLAGLSLLPTSGTKFYQYAGDWQMLYSEDFTAAEKEKIVGSLHKALGEAGYEAEQVWGEVIEDRGSQITFSALGQQAPLAAKAKWDPGFAKRKKITAVLDTLIPEFSVRMGGATSIDVTKHGIDKAYGIGRLRDILGIPIREMVFIGDALFPGGNDYPAKEAGVVSLPVRGPGETKLIVAAIIACLDGAQ